MSFTLNEILRSFFNTLVYIWTCIHILFSRGAKPPSSSSDKSTPATYPDNIDLERGIGIQEGGEPDEVEPPIIIISAGCQNAVREVSMENAQSDASRNLPLSSSDSIKGELKPTVMANDIKSASNNITPLNDDTATICDSEIPSNAPLHPIPDPSEGPSLVNSPAPTLTTIPVSPENGDLCHNDLADRHSKYTKPESSDLSLRNTQPRTPKQDKGHKRAVLATITNIAHVSAFSTPTKLLSSPKGDSRSAIRRTRSPSLRRKPAFEDLHSSSPTRKHSQVSLNKQRSSPTKRPVSVVWFADTNVIPVANISPLRIVKHTRPEQTLVRQASPIGTGDDEAHSRDVVSTIRDAFVDLREEDEGLAARELINRASVWTCKTTLSPESNKSMTVILNQEEEADDDDDEDEDEYGDASSFRSVYSPPPPYVFSESSAHTAGDEKSSQAVEIIQPQSSNTTQLSCSPSSGSTELSYLQDRTPFSSMDSSLDDLLTEFEELIATMGPKLPVPPSNIPGHTFGGRKPEIKPRRIKSCNIRASDIKQYQFNNHEGNENSSAPHWSEVLHLDAYTT